MTMTIERLHQLFDENVQQNALAFEGNCHDCGQPVRVEVSLKPEGFQIKGGAVFEPEPQCFFTKCDTCFKAKPQLTNFKKCEVYSRIVGYYRPLNQWNEGKRAEFDDRQAYNFSFAS
jgi:hypothetical protein